MRVRSELKQKQSLIQRNEKLNQELGELNKILAQNYAIHLIPGQFRNVEGVCYLYEYLSTSRESFQSALINFNMNRLNRNMQHMIQRQGEMLIRQYITNTRLSDMKNQNKAMLSKLCSIEQNTELAAKYAAMNEMNTRTISFFKAYEFFRQTYSIKENTVKKEQNRNRSAPFIYIISCGFRLLNAGSYPEWIS